MNEPMNEPVNEPVNTPAGKPPTTNRALAGKLVLFAAGSFAFGFALVPLYDVLCSVWEVGNRWTGEKATTVVEHPQEDRLVTVEFIASVPDNGTWHFAPKLAAMQVHPGKLYSAEFSAANLSGHDTVGQAVPSIAPSVAMQHFRKTECFCFTPQPFRKGETRSLPVRFVVDRDLPADVDRVTLSYAIYEQPKVAAAR